MKEVQTNMEEREAWKAEILKYYRQSWYKRVLRLMAANETFDPRERLVTLKDAARRLGVNPARLREIAAEGMISVVATPNGRSKVVESSLNSYIGSLRKKAG